MERDRTTKVVAICGLLLAVVGVSLGFAAFSQNLKISSAATVTPSDNMYIYFASSDQKNGEGEIVADPVGASPAQYDTVDDTTVEHKAIIDNSNNKAPAITGLRADFTAPGQSVTYSFYAYNAWEYAAYLKSINIDATKVCEAKDGALSNDEAIKASQEAKIVEACKGISISVKVGNEDNEVNVDTTTGNIANHTLAKDSFEPVVVTITYAAGSSVADTDFDVTFGDVTLNYSSTN